MLCLSDDQCHVDRSEKVKCLLLWSFSDFTKSILSNVVYNRKQILLNLWPDKAIDLTVEVPALFRAATGGKVAKAWSLVGFEI